MKPAGKHGKGLDGRELAEVETASHQREQHRAPDSPGTHTWVTGVMGGGEGQTGAGEESCEHNSSTCEELD